MLKIDQERLGPAAVDFLYLMDRGYPRSASLELIGNRHNLDRLHRDILHRGVFSRKEAEERRARLVGPEKLVNAKLMVDGHNVLITTESALVGRPLIAANDGVIRDVAGISHRYRLTSLTEIAVEHIFRVFKAYPPGEILFLLDAPIRHSGELAAMLRNTLRTRNCRGDAQAVRVPEKTLIGAVGIVASSDSAVLDAVRQGFDLPATVIDLLSEPVELVDLTFLGRES